MFKFEHNYYIQMFWGNSCVLNVYIRHLSSFLFPQQRWIWGHGVYAQTRPDLLCFPKRLWTCLVWTCFRCLLHLWTNGEKLLIWPSWDLLKCIRETSLAFSFTVRENTKHILSSSFFFFFFFNQMVAETYFEDIRRKIKLLFHSKQSTT